MPLQHYLPATFLANFSLDSTTLPRRKRKIYFGIKENQEVKEVSAEDVGAINNLYTMLDYRKDPNYIDKIWQEFEAKLHVTIPRLIVGDIDAKTWIRFLVPFITCMLVRGPDFDERFSDRISSIFGKEKSRDFLGKSQINSARIIEIQRLLFPITAAKWIVIYMPGSEYLITNDLGYCPFAHKYYSDQGMAVPLGKNHVLCLVPRKNGEILNFFGGKWRPKIYYTEDHLGNNEDLNRSIASRSQRFIFSSTFELAEKYIGMYPSQSGLLEPEQLGFFDSFHSRAYEFTWHRLAIFLEKNSKPIDLDEGFFLEWKYLFDGWNPPVVFPTNLRGFPPPLKYKKFSISLKYYDPSDYYLLNEVINLEEMELYEKMINKANMGFQTTQKDELKNEFLFAISIGLNYLSEKETASKILDLLIEEHPKYLKARLNRSADYLENGEIEKALIDLEYILSIDPSNIEARISLANCYLAWEKYQESINEANTACEQAPKGNILGLALYSRALACFLDQQLKKAFFDFSSALKYLTEDERIALSLFYRSIAWIRLYNDYNKVPKNWEFAGDSDKKGENKLKKHCEGSVIEDLTSCINIFKKSQDSSINLGIAFDLRGSVYIKQDALNLALEDYSNACKFDPNNVKYYFVQGELFISIGKFDRSIEMNDKVLELSPNNPKALNNRGIAKLLLGFIEEAKADFLDSIEFFGDEEESGSPLRHLAQISLLEGNVDKAKIFLSKSREIDPTSFYNDILESLVYIYSTKSIDALRSLEIIVKLENNPDLIAYQIIPLLVLGRIEEAKKLYTNIIEKITNYTIEILKLHIHQLNINNMIEVCLFKKK